ncbi:class I SAM-dependent methyltransferase [Jeotgalibacillus terrae]|uniref:Class I SAM-dependent methyltransferase n=1 Tax=Jeotgalibacillus terrae TaxID=587735 RepID=A0ABW5ZIK7_9BACL|nr:class I SAM-dependent methyltransferase [Jeotgalibacillus terrae]MBM7579701.1 2-polyprenyl-3-methyl-5-hydroxy-6-metoxy-1,4-benzoquinol methylase [Jeotgalibacillus terrae]
MNNQSSQNKLAWEHRAYEFWCKKDGTPENKAKEIMKNPEAALKKHKPYFDRIEGMKIANICGSNGRKAVPLSILGADVTVFDLSEENRRYALELAHHAGVTIQYITGDIYDIDLKTYKDSFDLLYLEGGILHYFDDIDQLMTILFSMLKRGGRMILSDYHPVKRCIDEDLRYHPVYFEQSLCKGDIAYKQFFDKSEQQGFPDVSLKFHTLSEIINSVVKTGFTLDRFDEHRGWKGENIPWEFTILAGKIRSSKYAAV